MTRMVNNIDDFKRHKIRFWIFLIGLLVMSSCAEKNTHNLDDNIDFTTHKKEEVSKRTPILIKSSNIQDIRFEGKKTYEIHFYGSGKVEMFKIGRNKPIIHSTGQISFDMNGEMLYLSPPYKIIEK